MRKPSWTEGRLNKFVWTLIGLLSIFFNLSYADQLETETVDETERVLLIWSYPRVYPWVLEVDRYFNEYARLDLAKRSVSLRIVLDEENLPYQGIDTDSWSDNYINYLREKYQGVHFDRIVTTNDLAPKFLAAHPDLFSSSAVYQIALNPQNLPDSIDIPLREGQAKRAWELINQSFTPDATKTLVVANPDTILNSVSKSLRQATDWFDESAAIQYVNPQTMTTQEVNQILREASDEFRIVYLPITSAKGYGKVIPRQYLKEISAGVTTPIYCASSSLIGAGCMAGYGKSTRQFGKLAAAAVYGNLNPDSGLSLEEMLFDEAKAAELGFKSPEWIEDSFVVNRQYSIWTLYQDTILLGIFLTSVFGLIVCLLIRKSKQLSMSRAEAFRQSVVLDNILKGTNVGTWQWNVQTGETIFNERWAEIIGYTLEEISPTTIETWLHYANSEDLECSSELLDAHFSGEADFYEIEVRMLHKEGHEIWILDRGQVATWTDDGKPEWMYGTHQDITEQKRLEEQLMERSQEAENSAKVKSEFLAAMSHEIRTPMNAVLGLAELASETEDEQKRHQFLEGILRSSKLLMGILNDVLDISRLEAGRAKIQTEAFDVQILFRDCIELFKAPAEMKGIELKLDIASDVPRIIIGDPIKIAQMTNNFLGNAVKFTSSGLICLTVSCERVNHSGLRLHVQCEDSGAGIAEQHLTELFKPFSQVAKDARKRASGSGLGLAIIKEYCKLMQGDCGVESRLNEGSRFWFEIKLQRSQIIEEGSFDQTVSPSDLAALAGKNMLIVEDNQLNVMVASAILEKYSISSESAENGVEAIRMVEESLEGKRRAYDLILMDLHMPIMDGLQATEAIKAMPNATPPIVGLTAAVLPDEIKACKTAGMDGFVGKPIEHQKLFHEILKAIESTKTDVQNVTSL